MGAVVERNMNKTHDLKLLPVYFHEVVLGNKNFEIRLNDRDFKVGDKIILREFEGISQDYTGEFVEGEIMFVTDFMQAPGYVVFSFKPTFYYAE